MRFHESLFLKWLEPKNPALSGAEAAYYNSCAIVARDEKNEIIGITFFETKDLNESLMSRFTNRLQKKEYSALRFSIYIPQQSKKRAEDLLKKYGCQDVKIVSTSCLIFKVVSGQFRLQDRLRVVNVDDSPVILKFLKKAKEEIDFMEIVDQITDPAVAVSKIQKLDPDLITMDIQMPRKNGVDVVKDLMKIKRFPILMISSLNIEEGSLVFEALNSGAFDYIQKPKLEELDSFREEFKEKAIIAIKQSWNSQEKSPAFRYEQIARVDLSYANNLIWSLGASTGGIQALTRVLTRLPNKIPPMLVVQHIPPAFSKAFAESLNRLCPFSVKEAEDGEALQSDTVYIAPGGIHMGLKKSGEGFKICLKDLPLVNRFKPSVDFLFVELSKIPGLHVVAGLLTGMGRDGAQGLLELKKSGAQTFAQDEISCSVFGMPRAAIELGAANKVISLDAVADELINSSEKNRKAG